MKHKLILDKTGGFPFDQQTLEFMQLNSEGIALGVASVFGPLVILSGVEVAGPNYTDGWVVYNGELLPFMGGTIQSKIKVVEVIGTAEFDDAGIKEVEKTRLCQLSASEGVNVSSFTRMGSLADLYKQEQRDNLIFPSGTIRHIKMTQANIVANFAFPSLLGIQEPYKGWKIDEASTGRVIVAWGGGSFDGVNADGTVTGGAERVTLTESEMPSHNHNDGVYNRLQKIDGEGTMVGGDSSAGEPNLYYTGTIQPKGGDQSHENMPPYVVYLNIVKL